MFSLTASAVGHAHWNGLFVFCANWFLDRIPFMYGGRRDLAQTRKGEIVAAIQEAQSAKRGIWSLGDQRVSAAEQKRILRGEGEDPAATYSF